LQIDWELAPSCCPDCDLNSCRADWHTYALVDEGFYDCSVPNPELAEPLLYLGRAPELDERQDVDHGAETGLHLSYTGATPPASHVHQGSGKGSGQRRRKTRLRSSRRSPSRSG
jgi:hypothetical protein